MSDTNNPFVKHWVEPSGIDNIVKKVEMQKNGTIENLTYMGTKLVGICVTLFIDLLYFKWQHVLDLADFCKAEQMAKS